MNDRREIETKHGRMSYLVPDVVNPDDYIPTGEFKIQNWKGRL